MNKKRLAALAIVCCYGCRYSIYSCQCFCFFLTETDAVAQETTEVTDFGSDAATQSAEVEVAEDVVEAAEASV